MKLVGAEGVLRQLTKRRRNANVVEILYSTKSIPYLTGSKNEPVCGLTSVFCVIMLDGQSVHCRARDHNW